MKQRYESYRVEALLADAGRRLFDDRQSLRSAFVVIVDGERQHHAAADLQVTQQRRRNLGCRGGHDDAIDLELLAQIRRAVTMAQGWIPMPSPASASKMLGTPGIENLDDLRGRIAIATRLADEHGRTEPLQIWFSPWSMSGFGDKQWDPQPLRAELAALADLGVNGVTVTLPGTTVDEFTAALDQFATDIVHHT